FFFILVGRRSTSPLFPYTTLFRSRGVRLARWAGFRGVVYGIIARVDKGQRARAARPAGPFRSLAVHRPEIERELEIHGRIMRRQDRKSTRLNSSHSQISYAVFCLK